MNTVFVSHVRTTLALHQLRERDAASASGPLLLLHGLGEHTPSDLGDFGGLLDIWSGPIWGVDFTGHGASSIPRGGGYTAETLMADTDQALAHLADQGAVTLLGRGIGSYVALLIAGARPELVNGVILTDGPGLAGGGPAPHSSSVIRAVVPEEADASTPDPYALLELARDIRPADYATAFARQAVEFSSTDQPVAVAAVARPPWLEAVAEVPGVVTETVEAALERFAR